MGRKMKKLICIILSLIAVFSFVGCTSQTPPPVNPPTFYSVTFKQNGYEDVVKWVESGLALDEKDIPEPKQKSGYIVTWEEVDLSCITENIVVNAVETPSSTEPEGPQEPQQEYTIYLNYNTNILPDTQKETIEQTMPTEIKVKYGEVPELPKYKNGNYEISGWLNEDGTAYINGAYLKTENTTLKAKWDYWSGNN